MDNKYHCGCTIEYPHSHLVVGHNCPCEAGTKKELKLEVNTDPIPLVNYKFNK